MESDEVEAEIQIALQGLCRDPGAHGWRNREWTRRVKEAVGRVLSGRGHILSSSSRVGSAWLWDGVALERDASGNLVMVRLALESEWMGKAEIKYDFEKLLAARAEHRVMVFSAESRRGVETQVKRLRAMIAAFRQGQSGDRYLLAGWYGKGRSPGAFIFACLRVGPH
ncbi:MAG: hypothetical protein WA005_03615 [Candidatus Binataceae bacterium]